MAKDILSKKPEQAKLILTRRQITTFREIIDQGNQMANFLEKICYYRVTNDDRIIGKRLAAEWCGLITRLINETI